MRAIDKVKAAGAINALRSALTDKELETLIEGVNIALEVKRDALVKAHLPLALTAENFGIPQLEALKEKLAGAYDIEARS